MTDPQDNLPTWVITFLAAVLLIALLTLFGVHVGWIE